MLQNKTLLAMYITVPVLITIMFSTQRSLQKQTTTFMTYHTNTLYCLVDGTA
jgi:hypothetical protein